MCIVNLHKLIDRGKGEKGTWNQNNPFICHKVIATVWFHNVVAP